MVLFVSDNDSHIESSVQTTKIIGQSGNYTYLLGTVVHRRATENIVCFQQQQNNNNNVRLNTIGITFYFALVHTRHIQHTRY